MSGPKGGSVVLLGGLALLPVLAIAGVVYGTCKLANSGMQVAVEAERRRRDLAALKAQLEQERLEIERVEKQKSLNEFIKYYAEVIQDFNSLAEKISLYINKKYDYENFKVNEDGVYINKLIGIREKISQVSSELEKGLKNKASFWKVENYDISIEEIKKLLEGKWLQFDEINMNIDNCQKEREAFHQRHSETLPPIEISPIEAEVKSRLKTRNTMLNDINNLIDDISCRINEICGMHNCGMSDSIREILKNIEEYKSESDSRVAYESVANTFNRIINHTGYYEKELKARSMHILDFEMAISGYDEVIRILIDNGVDVQALLIHKPTNFVDMTDAELRKEYNAFIKKSSEVFDENCARALGIEVTSEEFKQLNADYIMRSVTDVMETQGHMVLDAPILDNPERVIRYFSLDATRDDVGVEISMANGVLMYEVVQDEDSVLTDKEIEMYQQKLCESYTSSIREGLSSKVAIDRTWEENDAIRKKLKKVKLKGSRPNRVREGASTTPIGRAIKLNG